MLGSVAIVGAGGVGSLLAALLSRAGVPTALYVRPRGARGARGGPAEHLPRGVRVLRGDEVIEAPDVRWSDDWAELADAGATIVAVKAWQVAEVCSTLATFERPGACVLTLQNGLRAAEIVRALVPRAEAVAGVCDVRCWRERPGLVRWLGDSISVVAGAPDGAAAPGAKVWVDTLASANVAASWVPDMRKPLWTKLAFIAAFGGVGALVRLPAGELRVSVPARRLLEEVAAEVAAVARASGVSLDPDVVAAVLGRIDALPATATASLQRDVAAGLPSELDDLIGEVVRRAEPLGVAVPSTALIAAALAPLEARARKIAQQ